MLKKLILPYRGLSNEVWFLALTTLVNRAGAMVIPFLSLYLTRYLGFSMGQVGWIMTCYGVGSVIGVYFGGKLSDRVGYYKVMLVSLITTGLVFIGLQYVESFYGFCLGIFLLTLVADLFRPAIWVALDDYSETDNRTRSVTLIRLAINLGFSLGPALGGLIITYVSYKGLFWVDGISCLVAALIIFRYLNQKSPVASKEEKETRIAVSPYRDRQYMVFWLAMFLVGFTFMQYFSTIPLYYNQILGLSEDGIGLMLAMNGFLIFLLEMPIVHSLENGRLEDLKIVIAGTFLLLLSFVVLNLAPWIGMAILGLVLMTFGEMLGFPFSNSYALDRSRKGNQGAYMAMYSMSFSFAHILGPNTGLQFSEKYGFEATWYLMGGICLVACLILLTIRRKNMV
jgi:predicted MFS family arabinose efflux permease